MKQLTKILGLEKVCVLTPNRNATSSFSINSHKLSIAKDALAAIILQCCQIKDYRWLLISYYRRLIETNLLWKV